MSARWVVLWESQVGGKGVVVVDTLREALEAAEHYLHLDHGSAIVERVQ